MYWCGRNQVNPLYVAPGNTQIEQVKPLENSIKGNIKLAA